MTTSVTPEAKALLTRWVERLERNEDAQIQGCLNRTVGNNGYPAGMCCLGVLTEEVKEEAGLVAVGDDDRIGYKGPPGSVGEFVEYALLPRAVRELLGLTCIYVMYHGTRTSVVRLNDGEGLTFPEIAALVREEYDL